MKQKNKFDVSLIAWPLMGVVHFPLIFFISKGRKLFMEFENWYITFDCIVRQGSDLTNICFNNFTLTLMDTKKGKCLILTYPFTSPANIWLKTEIVSGLRLVLCLRLWIRVRIKVSIMLKIRVRIKVSVMLKIRVLWLG